MPDRSGRAAASIRSCPSWGAGSAIWGGNAKLTAWTVHARGGMYMVALTLAQIDGCIAGNS